MPAQNTFSATAPGALPPSVPGQVPAQQSPEPADYLGAHVVRAFDRTTSGRALEEYEVLRAEQEEGTGDENYTRGQAVQEFLRPFAGLEPLAHRRAMTEEEWKNSEYYIPTARYRPDMTVTRARIMKEHHDARRYREALVAGGDEAFGPGMKALGFGASLLGGLPDPVNVLPFAGGLKVASASSGALRGLAEGAVGTAVADALVLPDLYNKGEDVGFADALLDIGFGAVLGAGFGGLGGWLGQRRRAALDSALQEQGEQAGSVVPLSPASPSPLPRNDDADLLRAALDPQARQAVIKGMEKALADLQADNPVDVAKILEEENALSRAYDLVKHHPLGGPPDEVLAVLSSPEFERILVERGPAILDEKGELVFRDKLFVRLFGSKAWGMVKLIWRHGEKNKDPNPKLKVTKEDIIMLPRIIREYTPVMEAPKNPRNKEKRWSIRVEDGVDVVYAVSRRHRGPKEPTLITVFRHDKGQYGQSAKRMPPESSKRVNSHHSDKTLGHGDTTGGSTAHAPRSQEAKYQQAGITYLITPRADVNSAIKIPDMPPAPPTSPQFPGPSESPRPANTSMRPPKTRTTQKDAAASVALDDHDAQRAISGPLPKKNGQKDTGEHR